MVDRETPGCEVEPMPAMMGVNGPPHGILRFRGPPYQPTSIDPALGGWPGHNFG